MDQYDYRRIKPLDVVLAISFVILAPLAHYGLPFPISAAVEVLLLATLGFLGYLVHRKDYEQFKTRQQEENKKQWAQLMGRDDRADRK
jgi:hypothetical protein